MAVRPARNRMLWIAVAVALAFAVVVFAAGWMTARMADRERGAPSAPVAAASPGGSTMGRSDMRQLDALRRGVPIDQEATPVAMARVQNADVRRERAYPMQPPTIPHSIDGYQVNVNTNRCMLCHARANAARFQAPPVSVTHYMDRNDQFLASISPRRYFCSQCHAVQTDAPLLVENTFQDIDTLLALARAESGR